MPAQAVLRFAIAAKDCGPLDVPQNSSVFGRLTTFPNEVSIRCDEGFIMTGPAKRKCQADGAWSGNVTLCTGTGRATVTLRTVS